MSLLAYKGSLTSPTATSASTGYTGVGFQPKVILFWSCGAAANGDMANAIFSFGWTDGTATRDYAYGYQTLNAQSTSQQVAASYPQSGGAGGCIKLFGSTAGTVIGRAQIVSFDTDGFTLNWTQATTATLVHYLALGGSDIANVRSGTWTQPSTTNSSFAVTQPGFKPDLVFYSADSPGTFPFGVFNSSTARFASSTSFAVGATMSSGVLVTRIQDATKGGHSLQGGGATTDAAIFDVVSMDATGFTLNYTAGFSATAYYLAIQGGQYAVGTWTKAANTTDTTQSITNVNITGGPPSAYMMCAFGATGNTAVSTGEIMAVGASDGTRSGSACMEVANAVLTGCRGYHEPSNALRMRAIPTSSSAAGAVQFALNHSAFTSTGFNLSYATNGAATAYVVPYIIFSSAPGLNGASVGQGSTTATIIGGTLSGNVGGQAASTGALRVQLAGTTTTQATSAATLSVPISTFGWYSWGYNSSACVGRGGVTAAGSLPTAQLTSFGTDTITAITACFDASAAVTALGQIYVWGNSVAGTTSPQCKFGSQFARGIGVNPPTILTDINAANAVEVAQTNDATFWRKNDGTVWGVGYNRNGEFGTGESAATYHATAVQLTGLPAGITHIRAIQSLNQLWAIDGSGNLWFAGNRANGADGTGSASGNILTHTQVSLGAAVKDVCVAYRGSGFTYYALMADGSIQWWGRSMISASANTTNNTPAVLTGVTNIAQVAGTDGTPVVYFRDNTGVVSGIGSDANGALCNGTWSGAAYKSTYTAVDNYSATPKVITLPGGRTASKLMTYGMYTYACFVATNDKQLYGWGLNDYFWGNDDPTTGGVGSGRAIVPPYPIFPGLIGGTVTDVMIQSELGIFAFTTAPPLPLTGSVVAQAVTTATPSRLYLPQGIKTAQTPMFTAVPNQHVTIYNTGDTDPGDLGVTTYPFTVMAMIRPTYNGGNWQGVICNGINPGQTGGNGFGLDVTGSLSTPNFCWYVGQTSWCTNLVLTWDQWNLITVVLRDSTHQDTYVYHFDTTSWGDEHDTQTMTPVAPSPGKAIIGNFLATSTTFNTEYFNGDIAWVGIWSSDLSQGGQATPAKIQTFIDNGPWQRKGDTDCTFFMAFDQPRGVYPDESGIVG